MSIESFQTATYAWRDRTRTPALVIRLTWAVCLGGCVVFWWFVLTALLG